MNRRALGALAGTFILIAFSMALGFLFMSWGKSYIEQRAEFVVGVTSGKAGCADIGLAFIEINRIPQICHSGDSLKLFVENIGDASIATLSVRVVDSGITDKDNVLGSTLAIGDSREITIPVSGMAKQVKITPKLEGRSEFCFDKAISADGPFAGC